MRCLFFYVFFLIAHNGISSRFKTSYYHLDSNLSRCCSRDLFICRRSVTLAHACSVRHTASCVFETVTDKVVAWFSYKGLLRKPCSNDFRGNAFPAATEKSNNNLSGNLLCYLGKLHECELLEFLRLILF